MWMAPNVVTLMGFIVNAIPLFLWATIYGMELEGPVAGWWCMLNAITYVMYTLFDNIDGK